MPNISTARQLHALRRGLAGWRLVLAGGGWWQESRLTVGKKVTWLQLRERVRHHRVPTPLVHKPAQRQNEMPLHPRLPPAIVPDAEDGQICGDHGAEHELGQRIWRRRRRRRRPPKREVAARAVE